MALKYAILTILCGEPKHGYAVRRELDRVLNGIWAVNQGQVYATLERLARDGLVTADIARWPTASRAFAPSAAGRRRLRRWLERPAGTEQPRSELPARLALLASVGDEAGIRRQLEVQRARCATLTRLLGVTGDGVPSAGAATGDPVAEAALRHLEAELAWLADVERTLLGRTTVLD
jgi:DNA-binding PadR family transcriptional regulator